MHTDVTYLLHFTDQQGQSARLAHAGHYWGSARADRLQERIEEHRSGQGARLMRAVREAGLSFVVAATYPGGRDYERSRKHNGAGDQCPICRAERKRARGPYRSVQAAYGAYAALFGAEVPAWSYRRFRAEMTKKAGRCIRQVSKADIVAAYERSQAEAIPDTEAGVDLPDQEQAPGYEDDSLWDVPY